MIEYEIVSELSADDILDEITKSTDVNLDTLSTIQIIGIISLIKDREEDSHNISQFICDELQIERRGNRSRIKILIDKYNKQFKKESV